MSPGDVFALNSLPFTSPLHPTATITTSFPKGANGSDASQEDESVNVPEKTSIHLPKLAGLMSARAILANPGLFAGYEACRWEVVETFMNYVARSPIPYKLTPAPSERDVQPRHGKEQERTAQQAGAEGHAGLRGHVRAY